MSVPVKFFHSGMAGSPTLSNGWGDMIGVLDACLVTGFNLKTINSLTFADGVATAVINSGHNYVKDQVLLIAGWDQPAYNGEKRLLSVTANSFTFAVEGSPVTPATTQTNGTAKVAPLGWEKAFSGTNKAAYRSTDPASPRHYLRVDNSLKANNGYGDYSTGWAKWSNVGICESMSDIDTITGAQAPFDPLWPEQNWKSRASNHFGWHKWYHARSTGYESYGDNGPGARQWVIVGDSRAFYFFTTYGSGYTWYGMVPYFFGDPISFKPGDSSATMLCAEDSWDSNSYCSYPGANMGYGPVRYRDFTGKTMLRDFTQVGNPVRWGVTSLNTTNAEQYSGAWQNVPFPNGPDFGLWLTPVYIQQENGNIRGIMPGQRWVLQDRPVSNLTILEGVAGEPGRKFLFVRSQYAGTNEGSCMAFDITGPWR